MRLHGRMKRLCSNRRNKLMEWLGGGGVILIVSIIWIFTRFLHQTY